MFSLQIESVTIRWMHIDKHHLYNMASCEAFACYNFTKQIF